jgi:hypothetical protein
MNCGSLFVYGMSGTIEALILQHCALENSAEVCQQKGIADDQTFWRI